MNRSKNEVDKSEDDLYMENLANLSIKMAEISHLADRAYAGEDLQAVDNLLSAICRNWKMAYENETDPVLKARAYGTWSGLSLAMDELELLITYLGDHTRELRKFMRGNGNKEEESANDKG